MQDPDIKALVKQRTMEIADLYAGRGNAVGNQMAQGLRNLANSL
jgi:hypothetical protein